MPGMDAEHLLAEIRAAAAPGPNPLVDAVAAGRAPLTAVAALAAEEQLIIPSDRRSFLILASRADDPEFFVSLARGEDLVLPLAGRLAAATGVDLRGYRPQAGCQGYAAYVAWLALNADPAEAGLALVANFAAWGEYCRALAAGLRANYGFADEACAFLDFFATPAPELEAQALRAVTGRPLTTARRYGRLLHEFETTFWHTLADY
ncbi:hypothetical protein JCM9533A_60420 [Catenuloplanes niger JCM 9533]